ncbi:hypothetical protein LMG31506_02443 [Cupriavidus yeoncheonensis]|uniref:Uncharacterized protein n=1 Tax=Cupriavidus yeoncheonensis TaxID=1462994 RepID=A0A916ITU2_9BURK|nr:hypothetical protein [Cupriavidus yeoncheonensis]CAG2140982.1 hypothetical protein LMG31506_02443 [Cupriavidus yeoncheonensis]
MNAPLPAAAAVGVLLAQGRTWVAELAKLESWPPALQADLLRRLSRQPAATLPADVEYFRLRLAEAKDRARPRGVVPVFVQCPGCRYKRDRYGFPTGTLDCVGTSKSCLWMRSTSGTLNRQGKP